jgi:dTDP-4-dehydrorhamnose reductase
MILILGSEGQISNAFKNILNQQKNTLKFEFLGRNEIDFLKPEYTIKKISEFKPQWIINAAAYTFVDKAESEKELCFQINTLTPIRIAQWCKDEQVNLIHYSTDYVFNGLGEKPWIESDNTDPINYYGQTKRSSEEGIIQSESAHLIFRISWVYHHFGNNFVKTMLKLGKEREELKIINDQVGYPSYAPDIAQATFDCIQFHTANKTTPRQLLHLSSDEHTTWYNFAKIIFKKAQEMNIPLKVKNIIPISTQEYPTAANRPLNSRLNSTKISESYNIHLPKWEDSLQTCLNKITELNL